MIISLQFEFRGVQYTLNTLKGNYPVGISSKFWCMHAVCARIEGAYKNVWMVKLI